MFNVNLPAAKNLNAYYKATDVEALAQFVTKRELSKVTHRGAKATREAIINSLVSLLFNYRTHCATTSSPSQLILPDSLKLLPLYQLATLKTPVSIKFVTLTVPDYRP